MRGCRRRAAGDGGAFAARCWRGARAQAAEAQAAAERRKLDEANDVILQQLKEAKRQKEEAERQERERLAAEQSDTLRQHGVTHVTFGEDL